MPLNLLTHWHFAPCQCADDNYLLFYAAKMGLQLKGIFSVSRNRPIFLLTQDRFQIVMITELDLSTERILEEVALSAVAE
jgi:hypothetical protein